MPRKNFKRRQGKSKFANAFRISTGPVVPHSEKGRDVDEFNYVGLPRPYGPPGLLAVARDPRTIFTYWNIDWPSIFEKGDPVDRQVHLRLHRADVVEETNVAVEPLVGHHYLPLSRPNGSYQVEIGYYQSADVWHSVAQSDVVIVPRDDIVEAANVDLATIPLHLSFQRLLDLFGGANDEALARVISRLQKRALRSEGHKELSAKERKILRGVDVSLSEIAAGSRAFTESDSEKLWKRTDALLGFGPTSPSGGSAKGAGAKALVSDLSA